MIAEMETSSVEARREGPLALSDERTVAPHSGSVERSFSMFNLAKRRRRGAVMSLVFMASTIIGIIALTALLYNIMNESFGFVAVSNERDPKTLAVNGVPLEQLSKQELIGILEKNVSEGLIRRFESESPLAGRSRLEILELVLERVVNPKVVRSWTFTDSLFRRSMIREEVKADFPGASMEFRSWIRPDFIRRPQSSVPERAGIRTALLGSLWIILITVLLAFPVGVGAAVYLEEYARDNPLNRIIQTNIYNLSGVPSIIYGMLGLAIFVRALEPLSSGSFLGAADATTANGRTILSAGLTLALLVLPIIIINSEEAIRAVPQSLRHSSYGVGATKWQTIWHHVLPASFDRILTGTILAISRAIGETAPLVVVGASTFVTLDPKGVFSKFTTLPIQIYQWTARPQREFRNAAAAAIVVLLVLLIALNASAVLLRNRYRKQKRML
jgi:phosphate transport system permease protein